MIRRIGASKTDVARAVIVRAKRLFSSARTTGVARLIAEGVAPCRLVAQGYGFDPGHRDPAARKRRTLLGSGCAAGGRVSSLILKRAP